MSFLTPLYALGLLAVPFSSLMFLAPTPPKVTRRSRIDHWLLLLLRAAALCLLAIAFARPFLRKAEGQDAGDGEIRRIALLVDTSASMRRGDLWAKAKAQADAVVAASRPGDQLAVFAFDAATTPVLSFVESAIVDPARRKAVASAGLARLAPTWKATDLGHALVDVVSAIQDAGEAGAKAAPTPRRVILISDLQQGSRVESLGDFEWPSDVELELRTVADERGNATPEWLADPAEPDASGSTPVRRVRVTNDPGADRESFELRWADETGKSVGDPVSAYVPPGESRVVKVPLPKPNSTGKPATLRLGGDVHGFDNALFMADGRKEDVTVLFVGKDAADDSNGLLYYLNRVFQDSPRRAVKVVPAAPYSPLTWESERTTPLVVVAGELPPATALRLRAFAEKGGTVLVVVTATGEAKALAAIAGVGPITAEDGPVKRDVMLGEIAFDHPLFAPFAGAQFNDFTKIRFWKYRRLNAEALSDTRVLARFEGGDPALIEKAVGRGRVVVMTAGWNPADGQLARSSKFVPLMAGLLEGRDRPFEGAEYTVGERVRLPVEPSLAKRPVVVKPDGARVETTADVFTETEAPGVYLVESPSGPRSFAVNLDPAEGRTAPLSPETLEQLGCRLTSPAREAAERENLRQLKSIELEGRQKYWRPLILAAVVVLALETWLAGRTSHARPAPAETPAT